MAKVFHHALPEGAVVDHYEIRGVLGAGGFSITYLGWDQRLECKVAIKEFLPSDLAIRKADGSTVIPRSSEDQENYLFGLERFLKEARILARFKEPNIVRVSNFLEANETAYMIMDYEEGEALSEYVKREHTIDEGGVKAIVIPILESLRAVHQQEFLHRDIKPGNIYLRRDGRPVLIDFGAARQALGEHSKSMTSIVTAGYAPFEQYSWRGKQGPWTDIYSMGATMYRCITGESPVESTERTAAMTEGEPDPLRPAADACKGDYSQEFLDTIDWMLTSAAKDRPQDVDVVIERLMTTGASAVVPAGFGAAEGGEGAGVDRDSAPGLSGTRYAPSSRAGAREAAPAPASSGLRKGIAAAVVLVVLAGGGYGVYRYLQPEPVPVAVLEPEAEPPPTVETPAEPPLPAPEPIPPVVTVEPQAVPPLPPVELEPEPAVTPPVAAVEPEPEPVVAPPVVEVEPAPVPEPVRVVPAVEPPVQPESEVAEIVPEVVLAPPIEPPPAPEPVIEPPSPPSIEVQQRRETERRIASLLKMAAVDLAALRLSSPAGNNALERYREVLSLDPDNLAATSGLQSIVKRYIGLAEAAIGNEQFDRARRHLERAEAVGHASQELMVLGERLASAELAAQREREDRETLARERREAQPAPKTFTEFIAPAPQVGVYPEMVRIKGGCFQMGSPALEKSRQADERQHQVCVGDFRMSRHEVTVGQFRKFVEATNYKTDAERSKGCRVWKKGWTYEAGLTWRSRKISRDDTHPVVCVSWHDAAAYVEWLTRSKKGKYRLPTEAEWEYAARAGTSEARFWGNDERTACAYANVGDAGHFKGNMFDCDDGYRYTAPVGSYAPNESGLYDMLGNVWEWTCSTHDRDYRGGEQRCPEEPEVMDTMIDGTRNALVYRDAARETRGGSWTSEPRFVRAANRNAYAPNDRYISLGFRVAGD